MNNDPSPEMIYGHALAAFAQVFDADLIDAETCGEVADTFQSLHTYYLTSSDLDAAEIREAIREAGAVLSIPEDWMDS